MKYGEVHTVLVCSVLLRCAVLAPRGVGLGYFGDTGTIMGQNADDKEVTWAPSHRTCFSKYVHPRIIYVLAVLLSLLLFGGWWLAVVFLLAIGRKKEESHMADIHRGHHITDAVTPTDPCYLSEF